MELFTLLRREVRKPLVPLLVYIAISGISNAFLIGLINSAAETVANSSLNWEIFIMYLLCMGIFFYTKRYVLDQSSDLIEYIINGVRNRLVDKVRQTELSTLERTGSSLLYARISQDATVISNTSTSVISSIQSLIMIVFTMLYVASVSFLSFALIALGIGMGFIYYMRHSEKFSQMWRALSMREAQFFEKLSHIIDGFKEIKMNRRKNEDVFKAFLWVNNSTRDQRIETSKVYNTTLIFSQIFFYLLLAVILFILPQIHEEHAESTIKVVASVLFIIGPLEGLMSIVPAIANANNSASNIMVLEQALEAELLKLGEQRIDWNNPQHFQPLPFEQQITLKGLGYQYPNSNGNSFHVGPFNLTINKGEIIFVTGGNGSGKSTFMKLLTGLYKPTMGQVLMDEQSNPIPVSAQNYQQFQNLFAIIFSDYHLFDKLYGIEREIAPEEVNALLEKLGLSADKTQFENGAFTNTHLSSGQKKRLALATALLEDKSIYVFDEVAADLDPEFRDVFYYEILEELKARNKTVFVVSHDQQYWLVPDRLLNMRDGVMHELSKEEVRSLLSITIEHN